MSGETTAGEAARLDPSHPVAAGSSARPAPATRRRLPPRRVETLLLAIAVLFTLVPLVVAAVRGLDAGWTPATDQALEVVRMHDVGTSHTPLLGPYSRLGWRHPGPLLFWVGAPFLRLLGPDGLLAGIATINMVAVVGALTAARRLGGHLLIGPVALVAAVMMHSLGPARLVDPWNPNVTYLPLLCFVLCLAAAAEGGTRWALPAAVISGSFVAQSHLGAAALVVGGAIGAAVWRWSTRADHPPFRWPWPTAVLGLGLWSGPLVDQLTGTHNLSDLASYFVRAEGTRPPLGDALGAAARELGLRPAWTGAAEVDLLALVKPAPAWTLLISAAVLGGAWLVARQFRNQVAARLVAFAGWLGLVSVVAITRVTDGLLGYVVRWTWPVGALAAAAVGFVATQAWSLRPSVVRRPLVGSVLVTAMAALTIVAAVATTLDVTGADLRPTPELNEATATMSRRLQNELPPGRYSLRWQDPERFKGIPQSVGIDLIRQGYDIELPRQLAFAVGRHHTGTAPGRPAIVIVGGAFRSTWVPPAGARRLTTYQPLSARERRRAASLVRIIRRDLPRHIGAVVADTTYAEDRLVEQGAERDAAAELGALQKQGTPYDIWLVAPGPQN